MEAVIVGPRPSFLTRVEPWLSSHLPDAPPQTVLVVDAGASDAERRAVRERVEAAASAAARMERWHTVAQLLMVLMLLLFVAVVSGFSRWPTSASPWSSSCWARCSCWWP